MLPRSIASETSIRAAGRSISGASSKSFGVKFGVKPYTTSFGVLPVELTELLNAA